VRSGKARVQLLDLAVSDFRNFDRLELSPSPRATVAVGPNGQGKTNLLEAIYFLTTLKPLRAAKLAELIRFGVSTAEVSGRFRLKGAIRQISVRVTEGSRQALVDGKKAQTLEDYFGGVSVVSFTPEDLNVVKGSPDERRKFLDRAVFNRFPSFLKDSRDYQRALRSRNKLLKEVAPRSYLAVYDQTVAALGARIWKQRVAFLAEISSRAARAFKSIACIEAPLTCRYQPTHLSGDVKDTAEEELKRELLTALQLRTARDLERGFTSVGPHADDLELSLGDRSARSYASQGQQRALVLAWKIAEIENLHQAHGFLPLLLLDDVSSELDPERNAYLMSYLAKTGAQVFLTTTDATLVAPAAGFDAVWYEVQAGAIKPLISHPRPA